MMFKLTVDEVVNMFYCFYMLFVFALACSNITTSAMYRITYFTIAFSYIMNT